MKTYDVIKKLELPEGRINMVLDTDTYNEIDDQFALTYILRSKDKLNLQAVYSAPFYNERSTGPEDGMEKSYKEILNILELTGNEELKSNVFRGSRNYLKSIEEYQPSQACDDLIQRARITEGTLYVAAIGAITNIASAIIKAPDIIKKIVVVWLGGHSHYWPDTREFNLKQDFFASKLIFDCKVPLIQIPCLNVASHLTVTLWELIQHIEDKNEIGKYLTDIVRQCHKDHFAYSRVIWDIGPIAFLIDPKYVSTRLVHSPILNPDFTYGFDSRRHLIRAAYHINRDAIFKDLFNKI